MQTYRWMTKVARSISSFEAEIKKLEEELKIAQIKEDTIFARILELRKLKWDYEVRRGIEAFHKSGKSLQELMASSTYRR